MTVFTPAAAVFTKFKKTLARVMSLFYFLRTPLKTASGSCHHVLEAPPPLRTTCSHTPLNPENFALATFCALVLGPGA